MLKKIYGRFLSVLVMLFGIDAAKKFDTRLRFRRKLNLKNPRTLADKVTYLFLHKSTPLMSLCTDKWAVREYIVKKGFPDILIPAVGGAWAKADDIHFESLPNKFILKATHGCKMNYIVTDKNCLDVADCKRTLQTWLNTTYGTYSLEPHYKAIAPRVYAERLLEVPRGLIDYKFHCLNGVPQFVLVCSERHQAANGTMQITRELFSPQWQSYCDHVIPPCQPTQQAPSQFKRMLEIARVLSADFPFVRVDLYEADGKVYFGELTFSPASGALAHFSDKFIEEMGAKLHLPLD